MGRNTLGTPPIGHKADGGVVGAGATTAGKGVTGAVSPEVSSKRTTRLNIITLELSSLRSLQ